MDFIAPYIKLEMEDTTIKSKKVILMKNHSSKLEQTFSTQIETVSKPKYKELKNNWSVNEFYDANINSRRVIMTKIETSAVKVDLKEMLDAYEEGKEAVPRTVKEEYVESNFHMDLEKTLKACKEETISVKHEIKGEEGTAGSVKEEYVEKNFLDDLEKVLKECEEETKGLKKETKCEQEPESAVKEEYIENNFNANLINIFQSAEEEINALVPKSEKETHETKQTQNTHLDNQETTDANKTKAGKQVGEKTSQLSAYEQVREANIREREAMLARVQGEIGELKQDLRARRTYRKRKVVEEVEVRRKSARISTMMKDTLVKDTMVKDTLVKDTMVKETVMKDTMVKDTMVKEAMVKEAIVEESRLKESLVVQKVGLNEIRCIPCTKCVKTFDEIGELDIHIQEQHTSGKRGKRGKRKIWNILEENEEMQVIGFDNVFTHQCLQGYSVCTEDHTCKVCGNKFPGNAKLKAHMYAHNKIFNIFKCPDCPKSFCAPNLLKAHKTYKHKMLHICNKCEFKTGVLYTLNYHMLKHSEERPFKCPKCSKGFKSEIGLKKHKKCI